MKYECIEQLKNEIENIIANKGIKRIYIAEKLGLSKQGYYQLLNKKNLSLDDINRILNVLDFDIDITFNPK